MKKDNEKKGFWGFLSEKYIILSLAAAAVGIAGAAVQGQDIHAYLSAVMPAAVLIAATLWINLRLKKRGVYHSGRRDFRKSADPRVMGTIGDISGIGCITAAFMGIAVLFSEMYLRDGGIFSRDNFMPGLLAAAAKAMQLVACVGMLTCREWSEATLYSCIARSLKISGGDCFKKAGRSGNYPGITDRTGGIMAVRLAAGIGFGVTELMCAVSGGGLPYSPFWAAILAALTLAVTETACVCGDKSRTEDKHRLMSKSRQRFCIFSCVMFVLSAFFFLFGFPIRSVFTPYEIDYDFDYYHELTGEVEIISVPLDSKDNAPLFSGFLLVSGGFIVVSCAAACAHGRDIVSGVAQGESLASILAGTCVLWLGVLARGKIRPEAALDGLMTLVCVSMICFMAAVNIAALLLRRDRSDIKAG